MWKELGLDSILKRQAGVKRSTLRLLDAIFVMVANRTLEPVSKLYCWEQWMREEVLLLPRGNDLELHHLYLGMDLLENHQEEIEKSVYFAMAVLMNADADLIFYDTTSLQFEVDEEDETELRKPERAYPLNAIVATRRTDAMTRLRPHLPDLAEFGIWRRKMPSSTTRVP